MITKEFLKEKISFWDLLNNAEKDNILHRSIIRTYPSGTAILDASDEAMGLIAVVTGEVRVYVSSEEGREVNLFKLKKGDICSLSAQEALNNRLNARIEACSKTELIIIPTSVFLEIMENNIHVKCYIYELMTERLLSAVILFEKIVFTGFDKRLAEFLLKEHQRSGSFLIRITQEQLAKETGSAREVVARMLKRFKEKGIVDVKRGEITILDINKLKSILK